MKLFLSAIEGDVHGAAIHAAQAPHVLTSYYYARGMECVEWMSALRSAKVRMIDSGAFTLINSVTSFSGGRTGSSEARTVDYDAYLAGYIKWLKAKVRAQLADVWIEIDIPMVTSEAWVAKQREAMINNGLGRGLINVWHSEADWDYWLYLLREAKRPGRSGWVAIEGRRIDRAPLDYARFIHAAFKRGVKVHGFRMTAADELRTTPFYSVDSSTWSAATTKHAAYVCLTREGGAIQTRRPSEQGRRRVWKGILPRIRPSPRMRLEILITNARAWVRAGEQLDAMWCARGVDWERAIAAPEIADEAA